MATKKAAAAVAVLEPPTSRVTLVEIPTGDLMPWENLNPRTHFDEAKLEELAESIRQSGVLEPILVHRRAGDAWSKGLILAGERRWRAAVRAGLATMPCLVREYTETEALEVAIIENAQRSDLSPIEEARGFRKWLAAEPGRTQQQLAERIGFRQTTVSNRIRLLELPPEILDLVESGTIPIGAARDLLLPFTQLAEKPRAAFFATLARELEKISRGGPLPTDRVHAVTGNVGLSMSRSLQPGGYGRDEILFDPKEHNDCGCGGPTFRWYAHHQVGTPRCFDADWWAAANARAKAAQEEKQKEEAVKVAARAAAMRGAPVLTLKELEQAVPDWQARTEIAYAGELKTFGSLYDPAQLPTESLVWVRRNDDAPLSLYCTDKKAAKRAEKAATRELNRRVNGKRAGLLAKDLEAVKSATFDASALTGLLYLATSGYGSSDYVRQAAEDLGIDGVRGYSTDWSKLRTEDVERLALLLTRRHERGELATTTPAWHRDLTDALRKEYSAQLPPEPTAGDRAPDVGSVTNPMKLPNGRWGYRREGTWYTSADDAGTNGFSATTAAKTVAKLDAWAETQGYGAPAAGVEAPPVRRSPDTHLTEYRAAKAWALAKYNGEKASAAITGYVHGLLGLEPSPPPINDTPLGRPESEAARTAYREGMKAGRTAALAAKKDAPAAEVAHA